MENTTISLDEQRHKKTGKLFSTIVHLLLLLIIFLPILHYQNPPPGQEGIIVQFDSEEGASAEIASPSEPAPITDTEVIPDEIDKTEEPRNPKPPKEDTKKISTDNNSTERTIKSGQAPQKTQTQIDADLKQKELETEQQRIADEQAATRNQIKGLFPGGKGNNTTSDTKEGNGLEGGDNDLANLSSGVGRVGGALGSRGGRGPKITENYSRPGKIVIKVCVDDSGKVISAEYTQAGSESTDATLKAIAIKNANNWKFKAGNVDKQCGTISYNFKVQ